MSRSGQLNVSRTKDILVPNEYILALHGEFSRWSFDEVSGREHRGEWRKMIGLSADAGLDIELGTGNGLHFAHRAIGFPDRGLVGLELKYKPLIQSIRRAVRGGANNARIVRYNAYLIDHIFGENEVNDVFIHFPDPWEKLKNHKHRMIQDEFLRRLSVVQKPGSFLEFKTDSREYFDWALEKFEKSPYTILEHTFNLHAPENPPAPFMTHFEKLFVRQKLPIHRAYLRSPNKV
jgi:tRNA (guanine-N7-)-methyltransferase